MFFRQLLYIVIIPIPQSNELKMKKAENICLAVIWQVKTIFPNTHGLLLILHYKKRGCLNLVYGVGNPWVINLYPYPYPPKPTPLTKGKGLLNPIPLPMGMGFDGYG